MTPPDASSPRLLPLLVSFHFALALAGMDLLMNLYHAPAGLESPVYAILPGVAAGALGAVLLVLLWGLLGRLTRWPEGADGGALAGLALALGTFFLIFQWAEATPYFVMRFPLLLWVMNLILGLVGYALWRLPGPMPNRVRIGFRVVTVLAGGAAAMNFVNWALITWIESFWGYEAASALERVFEGFGFLVAGLGWAYLAMIAGRGAAQSNLVRALAGRAAVALPSLMLGYALFRWKAAYGGEFGFPASLSTWTLIVQIVLIIGIVLMLIRLSPWMLGSTTALLTLVLLLGTLAYNRQAIGDRFGLTPYVREGRHPRHLILVSSDALRADVLETYGGDEIRTPNLARFAGESMVFDEAISAASWTLPAFTGMFTGLAPGVFDSIGVFWRMPGEVESLAERLVAADYYTGAVGMNPLLRPRHGLDQGFRTYDFFPRPREPRTLGARVTSWMWPDLYRTDRSSEELKNLTVEWIEENRERDFFLWLHFWDPHTPLGPPEPFRPEGEGPRSVVEPWERSMDIKHGAYDPGPKEREWIRQLYLQEVRYVDAMFGELMERLKELGVYEDALIVFTSDHGEEFWDHGEFGHGQSLFHELIRVPLMIKSPGDAKRGRVSAPVWTVSLMPTILDFADVGYGEEAFSAPSLLPFWEAAGTEVPRNPIFSETAPEVKARHRWGVRFEDYEYMQGAEGKTSEELYHLRDDPGQVNDVSTSDTTATSKGADLMGQYHEQNGELRQRHEIELRGEIDLPQEEVDRLRKLGYI